MTEENLDFIPIPLPKDKKETEDFQLKRSNIMFKRSNGLKVKARMLDTASGDETEPFDIIDDKEYEINGYGLIKFFYNLQENKQISMIHL